MKKIKMIDLFTPTIWVRSLRANWHIYLPAQLRCSSLNRMTIPLRRALPDRQINAPLAPSNYGFQVENRLPINDRAIYVITGQINNYIAMPRNTAYKAFRYLFQSVCSTGFPMCNLRFKQFCGSFSRFFYKEVITWQTAQLNGSTTQRDLVL